MRFTDFLAGDSGELLGTMSNEDAGKMTKALIRFYRDGEMPSKSDLGDHLYAEFKVVKDNLERSY